MLVYGGVLARVLDSAAVRQDCVDLTWELPMQDLTDGTGDICDRFCSSNSSKVRKG